MDQMEAKVLAELGKELVHAGVQLGSYVGRLAEKAAEQKTYHTRIRDPFPRNERLRIWLGNVDDAATVRVEGLVQTVRGNAPEFDSHITFRTPGPNVLILELVNSLSGNTRCDFRLMSSTTKLIAASPEDFDVPPLGLQRNYIWTFTVA
jgi:hypothetical protein